MSDCPEHRVIIQLRYTEYGTPWKWQGTCGCGWRCLSWYWSDGERGALPMSREHVAWPVPGAGSRRKDRT